MLMKSLYTWSDGAMRKDGVNASVAECLICISGFSERLNLRGISIYSKELQSHICFILILMNTCILNTDFTDCSYSPSRWISKIGGCIWSVTEMSVVISMLWCQGGTRPSYKLITWIYYITPVGKKNALNHLQSALVSWNVTHCVLFWV